MTAGSSRVRDSVAAMPQKRPRRTFKEWLVKYFVAGQKLSDDHEQVIHRANVKDPMKDFAMRHRKLICTLAPTILVQIFYWLMAYRHGFWRLFPKRYEMAIVMAFGSTVGGATAEGSAAIAFPVMTLLLHVTPETARDFAVMCQSFGMGSAAVSIMLLGLVVEWHTLFFATFGGSIGTIVAIQYLDHSMGPQMKKMIFVSVFFAFAIALYLLNREKKRVTYDVIQDFGWKRAAVLTCNGIVGGLFNGIAGTGLNIFTFSVITLLYRINEKVATPTTVMIEAITCWISFFWRAQMMGDIPELAWEYFAVAIPVACIVAPLGAYFSSYCHRMTLAVFIYILETIALVGAIAIIRPGWEILLLCAGIVVFAYIFFHMLSKLGEREIINFPPTSGETPLNGSPEPESSTPSPPPISVTVIQNSRPY